MFKLLSVQTFSFDYTHLTCPMHMALVLGRYVGAIYTEIFWEDFKYG